jgi:hypothetical protein
LTGNVPGKDGDANVLALFEGAGPVETPSPGAKAWLAIDSANARRAVLIKRVAAGQGKGRATEALTLHHERIARTRRWLFEGGSLYVVRDLIRGKNLRQTIAAQTPGGLDLEQVRGYLLPVIEALEFAHGRGIAHGGVSPENVLVADDARILLTDFGTTDPRAPAHAPSYGGTATTAGDVKAMSRLIATYLPTRGAFASSMLRGRIEGLLGRCETLAELRETLEKLDKVASAPPPRVTARAENTPAAPTLPELPRAQAAPNRAEPRLSAAPELSTQMAERPPIILPGGGGSATLILRNEGSAPLIVRMIATQHAWLNVRPVELPLTVAPGGSSRIAFSISAARLTPGEYRSEVYLSANAGGQTVEDLRGGWFKHTSEVRVTVGLPPPAPAAAPSPPPFPADAPRLPAVTGCGTTLLFSGAVVAAIIAIVHAAIAAPLPVK